MRPSFPALKKGSSSSKQWLARQAQDPYVKQRLAGEHFGKGRPPKKPLVRKSQDSDAFGLLSAPQSFRSRSAFKLIEIDKKYRILEDQYYRPCVVVDLGAAPGGWSQVIANKLTPRHGRNDPEDYRGSPTLLALDLIRIQPIPGVVTLQGDFLFDGANLLPSALPQTSDSKCVDLIMSDMAANATGNTTADISNSIRLAEAVYKFADRHLAIGGRLVMKYFDHPDARTFQRDYLEPNFRAVFRFKPQASRSESAESYWICKSCHRMLSYQRRPLMECDLFRAMLLEYSLPARLEHVLKESTLPDRNWISLITSIIDSPLSPIE